MKYKDWNVRIKKEQYRNGRIALRLIDLDHGFPIATATVNIPEAPCGRNEAYIKNWSENEDILDFLIDNRFVESTGKTFLTGHMLAHLVKVLI